ncbi:MAG: hypothetical protein O6951_05585 [Actinobacteria bacterium]|nr:hypothetical protein [Actinomycetota bacterium]
MRAALPVPTLVDQSYLSVPGCYQVGDAVAVQVGAVSPADELSSLATGDMTSLPSIRSARGMVEAAGVKPDYPY